MLALAGINVLATVAFGLAYAVAGKELLSQGAFLAALGIIFVASTALWVSGESRQGSRRDALSRLGRIVVGLVLPVVAVPGVVLTPLFFLHEQLPREAGVADITGRAMFLLLTSLALMILVNVAGIAFVIAASLLRWWRRRPARPFG